MSTSRKRKINYDDEGNSEKDWKEDLGIAEEKNILELSKYLNESDINILNQKLKEDSLWKTFETSQTFTYDFTSTQNMQSLIPYYRTFQFVRIVGDPGSYGAAILVINQSDNRPYIIKLSIADNTFRRELSILYFLLENSINTNISPNFTVAESWFISEFLPPNSGTWTELYDKLKDIEIFKKMVTLQDEKKMKKYELPSKMSISSLSKNNSQLFGYIVMEYAGEGTLSNFRNLHISKIEQKLLNDTNKKIQTIQQFMKNIMFQLLFALFAMNIMKLQHRDLASSNILLIDETKREVNYLKFKRPLLYTVDKLNFILKESEYYPPLTLIIIDYSLSTRILKTEDNHIFYPKVKLSFRPPELLFVNRNDKFVIYRRRSDMFSAGSAILHAVMGTSYLNLFRPPQKLIDSISEGCTIGEWSEDKKNVLSSFICTGESASRLANYIWNLFKLIGPPTPELWPDIVKSDLYKRALPSIEEFKNEFIDGPFILQPDRSVMRYLGSDGVDLIKKMMEWNPTSRPDSSLELLQKHPYFSSIRSARNLLNDIDTYGSRWGVDGIKEK